MILETIRGDIFESPHKHIIFAVNTEGFNDAGFAGLVAYRYWPELANTGPQIIGTVLSKESDERVFHAVVCHSLSGEPGWNQAPETVRRCLDELDVPEEEVVGAVLVGAGLIGMMSGANPHAIHDAMNNSNRQLKVYHL